jgi:hypothetical protein
VCIVKPLSIHRPHVLTETPREYSLAVSLQVAEQRIAADEHTINLLRQQSAAQYDGLKELHRAVSGLRQQVRQLEVDKARLTVDNARLDFAFTAATWVVEDLRKQLGDDDVDVEERFDLSDNAEAIAEAVLR